MGESRKPIYSLRGRYKFVLEMPVQLLEAAMFIQILPDTTFAYLKVSPAAGPERVLTLLPAEPRRVT